MIDYEYINTRIRALEVEALSSEDLQEIFRRGTLEDIRDYLKKTSYGPYIREETRDITLILDEALRLYFTRTMTQILQICKGAGGDLIEIVLSLWDLYNIKTLLRGRVKALPVDVVATSFLPAGSLREFILREAYRQPSIQAMVDMLITMGYTFIWPLKKFRYISDAEMIKIETELDKNFYSHALKRIELSYEKDQNKHIVKDIFRLIIDRINLLLVFKGLMERISPEEMIPYFIRGGKLIPPETFRKMLECRNVSECVAMVGSDIWKLRWERYKENYPYHDVFFIGERWIDHEIFIYSRRVSRRDPFNISSVIACIWGKVFEITNLRIIIKGIQYGVPREEIEDSIAWIWQR